MGSSLGVALFEWTGTPRGMFVLLSVVSAACIGIVLLLPRLPRWASLGLLSFESLVALAVLWLSADTQAASGRPFAPFNGIKILSILIAIFCPSVRLGSLIIGVAVAQAFVQTAHWSAGVRSHLPPVEPWQTFFVAGIAVGLLMARRRHAAIGEELARVQAEQSWLERVARLALFVRDLTQAPLRMVRDRLRVVQERHSDTAEPTARMERAVTRLEQLNQVLAPLDRIVPIRPGDASLDAIEELRKMLQATRPEASLPAGGKRKRARVPTPEEEEEARRAALYLGAIMTIAGLVAMLVWSSRGYSELPGALGAGMGVAILALALSSRRLPGRVYEALFGLSGVVAILGPLMTTDGMIRRGGAVDACPVLKVAVLFFAFLAPSGRIGAALVGLSILGPIGETYLWWSAEQRSRLPMLEPWQTVFIGLVAIGVLAAQRQHVVLVRKLAKALADRSWLSRVSKLVLSVYDFTNTPLQTLVLGMKMVRRKHADPELDDLEVAMHRLQQLNDALAPLDPMIERQEADLSFNVLERIQAEVRQTLVEHTGDKDHAALH